jgi:hypothetical protein
VIPLTRPIYRSYGEERPSGPWLHWDRPAAGGAPAVTRPVVLDTQGRPFLGMDPSDPATWTRPWNPAPGMIVFLNFDGAKQQGRTPTQIQRGAQWSGAAQAPGRKPARHWWRR